MEKDKLPIIDVSNESEEMSKLLFTICKEVGFFYLVGHGIEQSMIDKVFDITRQIFELPQDTKMKYKVDKNNRGYVPFYDELLDPSKQKLGDTKEGFYFGKEVEESGVPLHVPNKWPSEVENCKEVIHEYMKKLNEVSLKVLRLLGSALHLGSEYFLQYFTDPTVFLHPVHYLSTLSNSKEGIYGAGAHTDYGMITLLVTDDVPGLQIHPKQENIEEGWIDIPPLPGAFIVNLGDVLERWTNGLLKSTLHRVVNESGRERYSLPFFFEPNFGCVVECLPNFCSDENPPKFTPTTYGDYLQYKYQLTHSIYSKENTQNANDNSQNQ